MTLHTLAGRIVLPDGIIDGLVGFDHQVRSVTRMANVPDQVVLPGFLDTHVHGGDGGDVIDGVDGVRRLARFHARHGTTTLLPTTITRPWPDVLAMLATVAEARRQGVVDGADIVGAHLEGPFISPGRLGAQPPYAIAPTPERVAAAIAAGIVRVVTLAPELDGADAAIDAFIRAGIRISIGHTDADYAGTAMALARIAARGGVASATHLFNTMPPFGSREPGPVGAILSDTAAYAELVLDTHHVHPASFLVAARALPERLMLITDAMRGAGLGDCDTTLGGQAVSIRDGIARLPGGSLAGSVLTQDAALRNALAAGIDLVQASRMLSANPARYLGLDDRGAIVAGRRADLVVLSASMQVEQVWVGGRPVPRTRAIAQPA